MRTAKVLASLRIHAVRIRKAGPRSLTDRRVDSKSIRFLTAVVRASLGSHVGKPSSAYGWSGGFPRVLRFSPPLWWTIGSIYVKYSWKGRKCQIKKIIHKRWVKGNFSQRTRHVAMLRGRACAMKIDSAWGPNSLLFLATRFICGFLAKRLPVLHYSVVYIFWSFVITEPSLRKHAYSNILKI